jgi:hypothetical protein
MHDHCLLMSKRAALAIATAWILIHVPGVGAIITPLTRADMERATGLARWPRSDADRARFHRPYVVALTGAATDFFSLKSIEVITEFRRLELIAEEHARLNDNFARAGLRDAEEAIRPWQGLVWIVARLDLTAGNRYVSGDPDVDIAVGGQHPMASTSARVTTIRGSEGELTGWTVEAAFPAPLLKDRRVPILIRFDGHELTRVRIDFAQLE